MRGRATSGSVLGVCLCIALGLGGCGNNSNGSDPDQDSGQDTGNDIRRRDVITDPGLDPGPDDTEPEVVVECAEECSGVGQPVCASIIERGVCDDSDGDGCFDVVARVTCEEPLICVDGACAEEPCTDECAAAGSICAQNNRSTQICADHDGDGCLEFSEPIACADGERCAGGTCPTDCADECPSIGFQTCNTDGEAVECGDADANGCLEWGTPVACTDGTTCLGGSCASGEDCLVISEYIEGDSNNKAIELFNCGSNPWFLDRIGIALFANDTTSFPGTSYELLGGTLTGGDTYTICNPDVSGIPGCDRVSSTMNFNGDDRLLVFVDSNSNNEPDSGDEIIDAFGSYSSPPGSRIWEDTTLRRCNPASFGGTGTFTVLDYYTQHTTNDFSDFGDPPALTGCP